MLDLAIFISLYRRSFLQQTRQNLKWNYVLDKLSLPFKKENAD